MTERDNILARIREALTLSAPRPGFHSPAAHDSASRMSPISPVRQSLGDGGTARDWLPPVGPTFEDRVKLFQTCSADLKIEFHLLANLDELPALLAKLASTEGWKKAAIHSGPLTDLAAVALDLPLVRTDDGYDRHEMESCDVGVTECDALIAQTGSVLLTSRSAGGRALSVLPPHHLVLARRSQMLPDLPAAFELLAQKYGSNLPSFITFATGPSRTGDIERILVLGAHGPKKLTIVCG